MAALKFLAIVQLLLVISPSHEMNMTHTKSLNLKRHGYRILTFGKHVYFFYLASLDSLIVYVSHSQRDLFDLVNLFDTPQLSGFSYFH